jgi:hypothetical protein
MLHAILQGKAGRLPAGVEAGASWRHVFKVSEDLLTASVFERLAYLDGALLWQVLAATVRPARLPTRKVAELLDMVMTFSVGDPPATVAFIVECKVGNGRQSADQWWREWTAFGAKCTGTTQPDQVWLLAMGGLPFSAINTVATFTAEISRRWGLEVSALAADWRDLLLSLEAVKATDPVTSRVVQDIKSALELHGYRTVRPLEGLCSEAARYKQQGKAAEVLRTPWQASIDKTATGHGRLTAIETAAARFSIDPGSDLALRRFLTRSSGS